MNGRITHAICSELYNDTRLRGVSSPDIKAVAECTLDTLAVMLEEVIDLDDMGLCENGCVVPGEDLTICCEDEIELCPRCLEDLSTDPG